MDIILFAKNFIVENPETIIGLLGLLLAAMAIGITKRIHTVSQENRFYDNLEKTSVFQIDDNVRMIEEILSKRLLVGSHDTCLKDIINQKSDIEINEHVTNVLRILSPRFAYYCANLEKYYSNIMPRKNVCFYYQENGRRAREILSLFKMFKYRDLSLEFAILHLRSSEIIEQEYNLL